MNDTLQIWLLISFVIIGTYCGYRAFWYKLFQLFIGRERLDTDPKLLKARVIFDTLRIFPPAACTERQKQRWGSKCWIYGVVALVLIGTAICMG